MKYVLPEVKGIKTSLIYKYIKKLEESCLITHNVIIARGGDIVFEKYWEPFNKDFLHRMYSVTKSFVSLAVGCLEQDGCICLDDPIVKYFPDELKNQKDENMANQTIREMLMMSTAKPERGWFDARCEDRVKFYFENDLDDTRPAGTIFMYDSTGSFVLGALVERVTKKSLLDYLREKFLDKIGFSKEAYMLRCPGGHSWGDSALICTPTDLLKVAIFCMNKGKYNGEQLLNEEYLMKATSKQIDNNMFGNNRYDTYGYGYQIWMSYNGSYCFDGMGCQLAVCIPDKDIILIYNGDNQGISNAKDIIIDNFFDIVVRNTENISIDENSHESEILKKYVNTLKLFSVNGDEYKAIQERVNNKIFTMNENPMGITKMKLSFQNGKGVLHYINAQGSKEIPFRMCENEFTYFPQFGYSDEVGSQKGDRLYKCAVSAAWVSDFQLFIKVQIIDTYFGILNIHLGFKENKIGVSMSKAAEDFLNEYEGYASGVIEEEKVEWDG